jgi:hypothetical protein
MLAADGLHMNDLSYGCCMARQMATAVTDKTTAPSVVASRR